MVTKQEVVPQHSHPNIISESAARVHHAPEHNTGGVDPITALAGEVITTGTVDGDRLPAISTTKKGAVPAVTPASPSEFLRDTGDFERIVQADVSGLETAATPQFAGLGIKTAGSDNKINLIEGAQIGIAAGPRQVFHDAEKLLELLEADVNIGDTPTQPGTGGTWSTSYDSASAYIRCIGKFLGNIYAGADDGKIYARIAGSWALIYTSSSTKIWCFGNHNGKFFAGGTGGKVYVTTNGVDFALAGTIVGDANTNVRSLMSDGGYLWATSNYYGYVHYSIDDGANWVATEPGSSYYFGRALISFNGNKYVSNGQSEAGGIVEIYKYSNAAWGLVYSIAASEYLTASFIWNGKIYFGGILGKIYASSTGALNSWAEVTDLGTGTIQGFVEWDAKLLAILSDKIYQTSDGVTWTLFYDSAETGIYGLIVDGNTLYAATGGDGKVLAYVDSTFIPAPGLKVFGNQAVYGQFRPGDFAGTLYNLLMSGGAGFALWLANGLATDYLKGGSPPVFANLYDAIIPKMLTYEGEILTYEGEVLTYG